MVKIDERVWSAVEEVLRSNPAASLDELIAVGKQASGSVAKLDRRQFNARYPLQIKRRLKLIGRGAPKAARKPRKSKATRKPRTTAPEAAAASAPRKRGRPVGSGRKAGAAVGATPDRDAIRQAFLNFATQLVSVADRPKDLVHFLAGVDKYVDQVTRAKG